uniref:Uncharacterized protein n=1 Tax=Tanacetum cinerariifolium TaxID=118510 RepID=A0A6L2M376_TANCI|nr:hypothetical protein [Tanacetum cinerariifolium]
MDLFAFNQVADPTKVKVGKKERAEREMKLLESIVGRVVLLLLVASARAKNEMDTSVEKLFDESGSTNQGDSIVGGDDAEIELVTAANDVVAGNVTAERPKRHRRKGPVVTDASEREGGDLADSTTGAVFTPLMFVIFLDYSHHSSTHASRAEVASIIRSAALSSDSDYVGIVRLDVMGSSRILRKELSMGSREELIDHLAPLVLLSQIRSMDYHYLFMEFIVGTARQACLNVKVRMRTEYYLSVRRRLELECVNQANLLKVRDDEVEKLKAQLLLKETKATKAARLCAQVSSAVATEKMHVDEIEALKQWNVTLENVKMHVLKTTCSGLQMACHLEDKFYLYLLTTISGQRWLLSHDPKLIIVKCLNSSKCLMALGAAISRAIKHGMHIRLATRIDHDKEDASVEDIMSLLHLESPLVDAPGMSDLHPEVELLWLPIHRSNDQVVLGETSLSFANLTSMADTFDLVSALIEATTALPTTFAFASSIPLITIEDYEIAGADGWEDPHENVQGNVASFPIINFEKEGLDTTLEHDLSS